MKTSLKIQNLKCHGCANTITKKLNVLANISKVEVNNEKQTVSFEYENESDLIEVKSTLHNLGYPEEGETNSLGEKAKSYVSCAIGRMS
jgi:copper chaperone CopZ